MTDLTRPDRGEALARMTALRTTTVCLLGMVALMILGAVR